MHRGAALALLAVAGCTSTAALTVDLRTDFVPGVEFVDVQTTVTTLRLDHVSFVGESYRGGRRVAEFTELPAVDSLLTVSLIDAHGALIASRAVALHVAASYALTVVITRSCRGVICPSAGDSPGATACLGGVCVDPACTALGAPMCTSAQCTSAADCTAGAACSIAECAGAACVYVPGAACGAGSYCDPDVGCRPLATSVDAGAPDAGVDASSTAADMGTATCGSAPQPCCATGVQCIPPFTCGPGGICRD